MKNVGGPHRLPRTKQKRTMANWPYSGVQLAKPPPHNQFTAWKRTVWRLTTRAHPGQRRTSPLCRDLSKAPIPTTPRHVSSENIASWRYEVFSCESVGFAILADDSTQKVMAQIRLSAREEGAVFIRFTPKTMHLRLHLSAFVPSFIRWPDL